MVCKIVGVILVLIGIGLNRIDANTYYFDMILPILGGASIFKGNDLLHKKNPNIFTDNIK